MSDLRTSTSWDEKYIKEETPWDINQACPAFIDYCKHISNINTKKVAVLGCGKGHDAFYLAKLGFKVYGFDFAHHAITLCMEKKKKAQMNNIDFFEKDFFTIQEQVEFNSFFDIVIEHTSFCAIDPSKRIDYLNLIKYLLKPKGLLIGMFYINSSKESSPPYSITIEELKSLYKEGFNEISELKRGKCLHHGITLEDKEYFGVLEPK